MRRFLGFVLFFFLVFSVYSDFFRSSFPLSLPVLNLSRIPSVSRFLLPPLLPPLCSVLIAVGHAAHRIARVPPHRGGLGCTKIESQLSLPRRHRAACRAQKESIGAAPCPARDPQGPGGSGGRRDGGKGAEWCLGTESMGLRSRVLKSIIITININTIIYYTYYSTLLRLLR